MKAVMLIFLFLSLLGCDEKLPKPSQKGANTFACRVNGKSWVAVAGTGFNSKKFTLLYSTLFKPDKRFVLMATRVTKKNNSNILLAVMNVKTTGTQHFSFETGHYPDYIKFANHAGYIENKPEQANYYTNSRITGSITFTRVDTIDRVVAGNFAFKAENADGSGETVKISDGRFDIQY